MWHVKQTHSFPPNIRPPLHPNHFPPLTSPFHIRPCPSTVDGANKRFSCDYPDCNMLTRRLGDRMISNAIDMSIVSTRSVNLPVPLLVADSVRINKEGLNATSIVTNYRVENLVVWRLFPTHRVGRNLEKSSIVRQMTLVEARYVGATVRINVLRRIRSQSMHGLPGMSRNIPDRMRRLFLTSLPFTTLPTRLLLPQTTFDNPLDIAPRQRH